MLRQFTEESFTTINRINQKYNIAPMVIADMDDYVLWHRKFNLLCEEGKIAPEDYSTIRYLDSSAAKYARTEELPPLSNLKPMSKEGHKNLHSNKEATKSRRVESGSREVYPGKLYRHFKGGVYKVLFVGVDSASGERVVIYESLQNGTVWTRTVQVWNQSVFDESGEMVHRFELEPEIHRSIFRIFMDVLFCREQKRANERKEP